MTLRSGSLSNPNPSPNPSPNPNQVNVTLRSGGLYVAAESALGSTPAFFESTIAWLHPWATQGSNP